MKKMVKNRIRCKKCGDIIESTWVHDFQECSCRACFVDGGLEYRRIGGNPEDIEDLVELEEAFGYYVQYYSSIGVRETVDFRELDDVIANWESRIAPCDFRILDEDRNILYTSEGFESREANPN